ncbi:MAG TPA: serpin family protein [Steroidobacteraceae bacterium]|nr:serpin family protein [Steroidobacteraceae bacterium]
MRLFPGLESGPISLTPTAVPAPLFNITVDHPFLYAIRDDQTGELLFIGAMLNPSGYSRSPKAYFRP